MNSMNQKVHVSLAAVFFAIAVTMNDATVVTKDDWSNVGLAIKAID